ncbi:MAG: Gfo/Idh/MocA family oxidoreductase [Planctomycetaceae bacterium]|nr:Gfo/Idh/MocA family oxidoreductase [Planctomycetaceae bacterium]
MKQVLQHLRTGKLELAEVPCPALRSGHLLIQTTHSLISPGTERMLVEFSRGNLISKARSQPDKVKQVLDKIKTDGLLPTLETVFSRLDEPIPMGYCNVGRVIEVGRGVRDFNVGDLVASNGNHAEMVCVPSTLAARIPNGVSSDTATFTVMGAIALQGTRLLNPTFGERFTVVGLGLLGLVAVQFLRAQGCGVLAVDVDQGRCDMAAAMGCETVNAGTGDPIRAATAYSNGKGMDGVLITASSSSDEIVHQAATMCRKRGRIVLIGSVGLNLKRADFYEKELSFQVSCSYGPGRYDPAYEDQARDYPRGFVRWTVARNFEAVLDAMAREQINVAELITRTMPHAEAAQAYDAILNDRSVIGVVMHYPEGDPPLTRTIRRSTAKTVASPPTAPVVGMIGAGLFSKGVLLPAIRDAGVRIASVASAGGLSSQHAGNKFNADEMTTDTRGILQNDEINTVFITTRHGSHADFTIDALESNKHVFVEKPLAIDAEGLARVTAAYEKHSQRHLMVGFNRRFAPHAVKAKELLASRSEPIVVNILVNAGDIPPDTWHHDPEVGGGRIIGEGCHFIDLAMFLVGNPIQTIQAVMFGQDCGTPRDDKTSISMTFQDGSISTVHYLANGPKAYPKETVTIFSEGRVLEIANWRRMNGHAWEVPKMRQSMDKGHRAEVAAFLKNIEQGGPPLIPYNELELVTRASFAAVRAAIEHTTINLDD